MTRVVNQIGPMIPAITRGTSPFEIEPREKNMFASSARSGHRCSLPRRAVRLAPSPPAKRKVGHLIHTCVPFYDGSEANDPGIGVIVRCAAKKLPAAVILIVPHEKDRRQSFENLDGGECRSIRRVVEGPVCVHNS